MGQESGRQHPMYAPVRKRSIAIAGNRTSVSLEDAFWRSLRAIAYAERMDTNALVGEIVEKCGTVGVSSAIRQFVLFYCHHHTLVDPKTGPRGARTASVPE
jgi:predicted DNA-binding ribbon-helix-helix protein